MKSYKLYYFNNRGRAEHIRQIFALAKVPYEDIRLDFDTWRGIKEEMPFGQVPVLEVDGVKIADSTAIARYLGNEFGFSGKNNLENAKIDSIAGLLNDASNHEDIQKFVLICTGMSKEDKTEYFKTKTRQALDQYASIYEKFLVENGGTPLILDEITWVDIAAAEFFSRFAEYGEKDALEAYPHIQQLVERIHNVPEIKRHIAKRPHTQF